jgi:hypothetical protein
MKQKSLRVVAPLAMVVLILGLALVQLRSAVTYGGTAAKPKDASGQARGPIADEVPPARGPRSDQSPPRLRNTDLQVGGTLAESRDRDDEGEGPKGYKPKPKDKKDAGGRNAKGGAKGGRRGRGIGPEVSNLATHGLHGTSLRDAVHALQAAHGIGKTHPKSMDRKSTDKDKKATDKDKQKEDE